MSYKGKPKVGILTSFSGSDSAYSLVNVVRTQLQMLLQAGYAPVLFVAPSFQGEGFFSDKIIEIRKLVPTDASYEDILEALRLKARDIQIMFCHDIVFLSQNQEWGKAARQLAHERSNLAWLHWQHSRGGHIAEPIENSWYCYPNMGDLNHVAEMNNTTLDRVRYVPHPLDFDYLGWPSLAIRIAEEFEFPWKDISVLYPSRLDRQKQLDKLIRITAGLKRSGKSVCLLIADAYATGEPFLSYKVELNNLAKEQGLTEKEFAFLGEVYEECRYATPRPVVKALLEMSNLFIQPSNAETSSLVVMEAALAGNLCIINSDFPPIHHLYNKSISLPFGSIFQDTQYFRHVITSDGKEEKVLDPQKFWDDQAKDIIIPTLNSQLTISLKRQQLFDRWPSKVFSNHLEPLMNEVKQKMFPDSDHEGFVDNRGDPEVTAIICTLDNYPMLRKQIPILIEEVRNIIVVNNGSIDGTKEYLDAIHDDRVKVIHRENKGAGPGRNAGLDLWDYSTPYTLTLDGGILPLYGGVKAMKDFLLRHPNIDIVSPEVATCYVDNLEDADLRLDNIPDDKFFLQTMLSGTAYALCTKKAWEKVRFSEEGPFTEPGWGVDDNDMMYQWDSIGLFHADFQGVKLYRRSSGSFQRIFEETGIWPNQYGSVYEKRVVKTFQDWRYYFDDIYHAWGNIEYSFMVDCNTYPELACIIKALHDKFIKISHEIIVDDSKLNPYAKRWLDTFALRWPWGDTTIDSETSKIIKRSKEIENVWSGDVMINKESRGKQVITIKSLEDIEELYVSMATPT